MPLSFIKPVGSDTDLGFWYIKEEESFFLSQMDLTAAEETRLEQIKGNRRLEWLAGRWLVHCLTKSEKRLLCEADKFGKPHLVNTSHEISLSHSSGQVVTAIMSKQPVGIDVQKLVPKIERIAHKYMRPEETNSLGAFKMEHLHIYWGAKESLYKAYGRRQLDFIKHIHIEPFAYQAKGTCRGWVKKDKFQKEYQISFEQIEDYVLVYAIQK